MNSHKILVLFFCFFSMSGCQADEISCHLDENQDGGVIYKVCNGNESKINFDYNTFVVSLSDDVVSKGFAILWQTPIMSNMSDERYFILNYKTMQVYDNNCLGGNLIILNSENNIAFEKYGEDKYIVFNPSDYEDCKQSLNDWVRTQRKW